MGAVATTLYAGVEGIRRGDSPGIGSLSQLGTLPLFPQSGEKAPRLSELLPLASLEEMVFGGWDLLETDAYQAARKAAVLSPADLARHRRFLKAIQSFPGVAHPGFTTRIEATHAKRTTSLRDAVAQIRADITKFRKANKCSRLVVISCMSVEIYQAPLEVHSTLPRFEKGLDENDPHISPSQLYAYAALCERVPFINGTPNVTIEVSALKAFARRQKTPIAGSDFKSGQTYLKTVIAAGLRMRLLGLKGWFSTNILGNRDGVVLEDPQAFQAKKISKTQVLENICDRDRHPELYGQIEHLVKINYFGPRGDNKEAWDSIDLFGWMGYPMELKINFECRDSILAAPLALDLVLFTDLAARRGHAGILPWLAFYLKAPASESAASMANDPFHQLRILETALRRLARR